MVVHEAETKNFGEVDARIKENQGLETFFVRDGEWKPGKSCTGNDVVYCGGFGNKKPGNTGHDNLRI
jgi:hypothetical protein